MYHKLQEGAIFIADSHYPNHKREEFLEFLEAINSAKIETSQLIFMGDNFDLLVGNSSYLENKFKKETDLINQIASNIEVIYLEGNHDFNLSPILKGVKVVPFNNQPLILESNGKTYGISHGDKFAQSKIYYFYTKLIRSATIIKLIPDFIAKYMLKKMKSKKICKEIKNFEEIAKNISSFYSANYIIEGHFHQGKRVKNYISLPSFACSKKVAIFKDGNIDFTLYSLQQ